MVEIETACKYWRKNPNYEPLPSCLHYLKKTGVVCDGGNCETCGWNPEVANNRKEAIREKMKSGDVHCVSHIGYVKV